MNNIKYEIEIAGIIIEVERKRVKNLRLLVYPPDGRVKVTAPLYIDEKRMCGFILSKTGWINKHRLKYTGKGKEPEYNFTDGEPHYLFGSPFALKIIYHSKTPRVNLTDNTIELFIKPNTVKIKRGMILEEFFRKALNEKAAELIEKWELVTGLKINDYGIKKMKTRWGSCNIKAKRIWLNLELSKKPIHCLEFIILHELIHLLEKHHNKRFYSFMDLYMPGWRAFKNDLNKSSY